MLESINFQLNSFFAPVEMSKSLVLGVKMSSFRFNNFAQMRWPKRILQTLDFNYKYLNY